MININEIFEISIGINNNLLSYTIPEAQENQQQTNETFGEKWKEVEKMDSSEKFYKMQKEWFLKLYGFESESDLALFLYDKKYILDTGCGLGYKSAWFAKLAPKSIVIGIDYSDSIYLAARNFSQIKNLYFIKGDIAETKIKTDSIDFTVCDQVIMHTQNPEQTFKHLSNITSPTGEFCCYVYSKKALPRELIDDYFRENAEKISRKDMWDFSHQLTELGKILTELNVEFNCPEIPLLGIRAGKYDIQRFLYWNFLKCFWNPEWGADLSTSTNFDWYAPKNAKRFSKSDFENLIKDNNLKIRYFHQEEACYSGRLYKC